MQSSKYEMANDFDLTDLDITKPTGESQDDITRDPRVSEAQLTNFYENRVADGILQRKP